MKAGVALPRPLPAPTDRPEKSAVRAVDLDVHVAPVQDIDPALIVDVHLDRLIQQSCVRWRLLAPDHLRG